MRLWWLIAVVLEWLFREKKTWNLYSIKIGEIKILMNRNIPVYLNIKKLGKYYLFNTHFLHISKDFRASTWIVEIFQKRISIWSFCYWRWKIVLFSQSFCVPIDSLHRVYIIFTLSVTCCCTLSCWKLDVADWESLAKIMFALSVHFKFYWFFAQLNSSVSSCHVQAGGPYPTPRPSGGSSGWAIGGQTGWWPGPQWGGQLGGKCGGHSGQKNGGTSTSWGQLNGGTVGLPCQDILLNFWFFNFTSQTQLNISFIEFEVLYWFHIYR